MENQNILVQINKYVKAYKHSIIILTANELGIFNELSKKGSTPLNISKKLNLNLKGLTILLNALVNLGLLKKMKNLYYLKKEYVPFLVTGGKYYIGDSLKHDLNLLDSWIKLPKVIKTGKPAREGKRSKKEHENFILAMANSSQLRINDFFNAIDLSDCKKFLDVGGGPGTFSLQAVRRNKDLIAYNFDLPETINIAKKYLSSFNESKRIKLVKGDYFKDDFGNDYDVILLSNIIHSLGEQEILKLFKKAFLSLNNEGKLIVKDFYLKENKIEPQRAVLFAINMLVNTKNGNTYTKKEVTNLLSKASFKKTKYTFVNEDVEFIEAYK